MNTKDKIYKLGLVVLDELLLHRNTSKSVDVTLTEAGILNDIIISVDPHTVFGFSEGEIADFYREWEKAQK